MRDETLGPLLALLLGNCAANPSRDTAHDARPARNGPDASPFAAVASEFARAWDAGSVELVERYVDPQQGVWLLYDPTIASCPIHHASLAAAIAQAPSAIQAPSGMGPHLERASFRCSPHAGPAPELGNCEDQRPSSRCSFGPARPALRNAFDFCEESESSNSVELRSKGELALSRERAGTQFLSDSVTGAVFYFHALRPDHWRLVAIDNSDCVLHLH